jgi:hypothetical protein
MLRQLTEASPLRRLCFPLGLLVLFRSIRVVDVPTAEDSDLTSTTHRGLAVSTPLFPFVPACCSLCVLVVGVQLTRRVSNCSYPVDCRILNSVGQRARHRQRQSRQNPLCFALRSSMSLSPAAGGLDAVSTARCKTRSLDALWCNGHRRRGSETSPRQLSGNR